MFTKYTAEAHRPMEAENETDRRTHVYIIQMTKEEWERDKVREAKRG